MRYLGGLEPHLLLFLDKRDFNHRPFFLLGKGGDGLPDLGYLGYLVYVAYPTERDLLHLQYLHWGCILIGGMQHL